MSTDKQVKAFFNHPNNGDSADGRIAFLRELLLVGVVLPICNRPRPYAHAHTIVRTLKHATGAATSSKR